MMMTLLITITIQIYNNSDNDDDIVNDNTKCNNIMCRNSEKDCNP